MKQKIPNQDEILRVLQSHAPRAMHVGELRGRLKVPRSEKDEVVRRLLLLADENLIGEMPGLRFRAMRGEKSPKRGREKTKTMRGRGRKAREGAQAEPPAIVAPVIEGRLTMTRQGYGFVNVQGDEPLLQRYKSWSIPHVFVIDEEGIVRYSGVGAHNEANMEEALASAR